MAEPNLKNESEMPLSEAGEVHLILNSIVNKTNNHKADN